MASKRKDIQDIGITFGNWKLVKLDGDNWELCHRHVTGDTASARKNGTVGQVRWHRLGRYYQSNTFHLALRHAADQELAAECESAAIPIEDALREYERIVTTMTDALKTALEARHKA